MSWASVVGNEPVVRLLAAQIRLGRVPHTALLVGPEGVGKRHLAREWAKALQCDAHSGDSCDRCPACRKVGEERHPDLILIQPEALPEATEERRLKQIRIDQIRRLESQVALTPFEGRWKVGIVDGAEQMTEEAAHACLKLLEEPPERTVFILISQAPHRLPATLVSRCHMIRCVPQGIDRVQRHLTEVERLDPAEAHRLAISSGGRLGRALALHRSGRLASKNDALNQLLSAQQNGALEVPLGRAPREEVQEALEWYAGWWRDLLLLQLGGDSRWLIHPDRGKDLQRLLPASPEELLDRIDRTYWIHGCVERNVNLRTALAALLADA